MPELRTPAGKPVDVAGPAQAGSQEFARAMAAPASDSDVAAPPPRPEAPYGYKDDGTPKKAAGRPKNDTAGRARVTTTRSGAAQSPGTADPGQDARIRTGMQGWAQIGGVFCAVGAKAAKTPALKLALQADAVTVMSTGEDLAEACVKTAAADENFARIMDRLCALGPYAALLEVGGKITTQLVRNHKPGAQLPGTMHPAEIVAEAERAAAAAAEMSGVAHPAAA
jgi:hypothetical protein